MNLTPLGSAIYSLIRSHRACASAPIIEADCERIEQALRALIRKELVILNVVAQRDPMD